MATAPTAPTLVQEPARQLERVRPSRSLWSDGWRRLTRNKMAVTGLIYIGFLAVVAIFAPVIAPHNPVETDVVNAGTYRQAAWISDPNPMRTGSWDYPLGTDSVGRDVFSRLVYGTRVSLVVGTHTHVPTADAQILPRGTAYQSDAGMCGDYDSVIGMQKGGASLRFWRKVPAERLAPAEGAAAICGLFVETDDATGLARRAEPLRLGGGLSQAMPRP